MYYSLSSKNLSNENIEDRIKAAMNEVGMANVSFCVHY